MLSNVHKLVACRLSAIACLVGGVQQVYKKVFIFLNKFFFNFFGLFVKTKSAAGYLEQWDQNKTTTFLL